MLKEIGIWVAGILAVLVVVWVIAGNNLAMMKVFAPATEQVRRETFEQSKAYRDGMVQELRSLQIEYIKAADDVKPALAAAIRHKAVGLPEDALPNDLRVFIQSIRP